MPLQPGTKLGVYEVVAAIGKGGMGEVYRARDTKLRRDVAIKVLPQEFANDRRRLDRFEREAKLLASLNHPNIAAIYGLEESAGTQFIVMELVEGESLAERLRRGAMDAEEALGLARQVAEGLDAAHEKGVIHRDIKPGNIQVTPDDHVKVLDFGLGKELVPDAADPIQSDSPTLSRGVTQEGVILGTAPYMSPEQARGKPVDKRADIWAFGCVLFEMLSGRAAFLGEDVSDTLAAVIRGNVDWSALPAGVAPKLRDLLRRCLEKDPKKRYRDIGDVLVDVDETLRSPHEVGPLDDTSRASASRPRILLASVALLFTGVLIGIATRDFESDPPRVPVTRFAVALPSGDSLSLNSRHNKFALSPDSSHLVYAATDRLYVRPMDQAQATAIPGTEGGSNPFFSPDGQSVGFWVSGELKKVPLGGGPAQRLYSTTSPHGVSWGADGSIVFSDITNIYRVPATGGKPEILISRDEEAGEIFVIYPEVLPDGDHLLFVVGTGDGYDNLHIVVQSVSKGERRVLIRGGTQPRYMPSGHLIYNRENTLLATLFDPASLEVGTNSVPVVEDVLPAHPPGASYLPGRGGAREAAFSVSPGGLTYLQIDTSYQRSLVWVDREGNATPLTQERRGFREPRISPDGRRIALQIVAPVGTGAVKMPVWLYDLETTTLSQFTFEESVVRSGPVWTPDGQRIAFQFASRDRTIGIYWKRADSSSDVEVPFEPTDEAVRFTVPTSFSPDGALAFFTIGGGIDSWILDAKGTVEPFLVTPARVSNSMFSPDGEWIAYVSDESGRDEVYVRPYPPAAGAQWRLSSSGGDEPMWSPDGTELFYRVENKMMAVAVQTRPSFSHATPEELFEGKYLNGPFVSAYDVHPDGDRFLMVAPGPAQSQRIHVVLNWSEELKRLVRTEN